jgi:uncharacterized OB-fold protein
MTLPFIRVKGNRASPPRVSALSRPFWDALDEGRFLVSECADCSRLSFPPRSFCPQCSSQNIGWREISGRGKLYSLTTVHAGPPDLMANGPYSGAIIDLEENVRLVTSWLGAPDAPLDSPVQLVVTRFDDGCLFAARSV